MVPILWLAKPVTRKGVDISAMTANDPCCHGLPFFHLFPLHRMHLTLLALRSFIVPVSCMKWFPHLYALIELSLTNLQQLQYNYHKLFLKYHIHPANFMTHETAYCLLTTNISVIHNLTTPPNTLFLCAG